MRAVVLAAGLGKRMRSNMPKVLNPVLGREMLGYVLASLKEAGVKKPIVVVGHGGDLVTQFVKENAEIAWQHEQLGTGHAVQCALPFLNDFEGDVLVTCGDTPLISGECYRTLLEKRRTSGAKALVATMVLNNPKSYGRIKRDAKGNLAAIVEFRDATDEEKAIREVNTGTYCFDAAALREAVSNLRTDNVQREYYLTDSIANLLAAGEPVGAYLHPDSDEFLGINDPADLAMAESLLGDRIKYRHLSSGILIHEPSTVRIEPSVRIGLRTRILPGVVLEGNTIIGSDCIIGPYVTLRNIQIGDHSHIAPHHLTGDREPTGPVF